MDLPILDILYKWNYTAYVLLHLISVIISSRFFRVVASISTYYFLWLNNILCVNIPYLFIHSSGDGNLSCFYLWGIMSNVVTNICVKVFVWTYVFNFPGDIPRNRIAGPYGNSNFLRNHQTISTILSSKQSVRVLSVLFLKKAYICIFLLILHV